jgi:hypothetical protein
LVERNLAKVQVASSSLVSRSKSCFWRAGGAFALCGWLSAVCCADPVGIDDHGHSLGKVSTQGELIVLELDDRSTAPAELFDLSGRTLLFKREGSGYRVATGPLRWDSTYGPELTGSQVTLKNFLTEPFGSILDYTWFRTVNRFQAVLARDGSIRMSYAQLAAKDAIVGVYPILPGTSRAVATRFSAVSSRDGPFDAVYQARPLLLPCSLASCRIGHRPDSCCDTTTRSGISDTKWGTAGPRMSPRR